MAVFSVLICGNSNLFSETMQVAFAENPSFKVIAQVDYENLTAACTRAQPDVVILKMDDATLLPQVVELKSQCPYLLPVMVVEDPNLFSIPDIISSGVRGCLPLRMLPRQIVSAVELIVMAGILCLPRLNPRTSLNGTGLREHGQKSIHILTAREQEVLSFLGSSLSNQEIAASLCLSESTVKTHLRNAFKKLKVRNRTEALGVLLGADPVKQPITDNSGEQSPPLPGRVISGRGILSGRLP